MKNIKTGFIVVILFFITIITSAQERSIHEIHSMMVFNFMKYIQWPPSSSSGDFVIGVIGDENVYNTLTKWYGTKSKGSQKIVVKKFDSVADIPACHVLYIGKSVSKKFSVIKDKLSGKATLLVTNYTGLGKKGSTINFKTVGGKLKFELNQAAFTQANLKVSSRLSSMAILI